MFNAKARHIDDADYTIVITKAPILDEDLKVTEWKVVHFQVRNSAMGYCVVDALWQGDEYYTYMDGNWSTIGVFMSSYHADEIPAIIVQRMEEEGLINFSVTDH